LPSQDRVHDGKPGRPGDFTDDMVDLQVHLRQRLVHVLHMLTGGHDQLAAVPQHDPNGAKAVRPQTFLVRQRRYRPRWALTPGGPENTFPCFVSGI
jgi:hypothetical protein